MFAHALFRLFTPIRAIAALCCALSLIGTVSAQPSPDQDLMALSIEELTKVKVYSASRHLESVRQAPSAVTVITAAEIRNYGWRTLADVLRTVRGFYIAYDRDYSYIGVRGFQRSGDYNSRILLLIDGHRLNNNVYDSAQIGSEFSLDLDLVDHIEIVRGPSSSLFGSNAVFGVINVITRRPRNTPTFEVSGDTSSFLGRSGRVTFSWQKDRFSTLMSSTMGRSNGHSRLFFPEFASSVPNSGYALDIDGENYENSFADVEYGNLRVEGLLSRRMKQLPTAPYGTNFNDPGVTSVDSRGYLDVNYHREVSNLTQIEVRTYYDSYDSVGGGSFGGSDPFTHFMGISRGSADWAGVETTVGHMIGRHRITVGGQYEYSWRVDQKNYVVGGPMIENDHHQPWLTAVFGEAELQLARELRVIAGGRFDWYESFGGTSSPRVALIYAPTPRTSLKYIFGQAFRAPNAFEDYYADTVVIATPALYLKPETIQSHDVVLEHNLTSWLELTGEAFYNHMDNLIDQQPDESTGLVRFVNNGKERGRGFEVELEAKRHSGLAGRASYTLADASDSLLNSRLANSPLHTARLNGTVPLSQVAFAGLELLFMSPQNTYQNTRLSSSLLANATFATKPLANRWQFSFSCYNVMDRQWFSPGGLELRQSKIQQDGRTFRFKVSYRLGKERN